MATPIIITDPEDPRIEHYSNIRERDLVGRQGRFIAEGEVVLRLLLEHLQQAGNRFGAESVLLSRRRFVASPDLVAKIPETVALYVADDAVIEQIAGFPLHRGVLSVGMRVQSPSPADILARMPERALVLVGIGIANHDNMGGLFRNAAAFGAGAVLLDATSCDPLYRKAIRVSVGTTLVVPFARQGSASEIVAALADGGFSSFALSPSGATALKAVVPSPRSALILGAEGPGLPNDLMARLSTVRIEMSGHLDSLNVATASGIALHHFQMY